jgi:hypothetical protein
MIATPHYAAEALSITQLDAGYYIVNLTKIDVCWYYADSIVPALDSYYAGN